MRLRSLRARILGLCFLALAVPAIDPASLPAAQPEAAPKADAAASPSAKAEAKPAPKTLTKLRRYYDRIDEIWQGRFVPGEYPAGEADKEALEAWMAYHAAGRKEGAGTIDLEGPLRIRVVEVSYLGCPGCEWTLWEAPGRLKAAWKHFRGEGSTEGKEGGKTRDLSLRYDTFLLGNRWREAKNGSWTLYGLFPDEWQGTVDAALDVLGWRGFPLEFVYVNDIYVGLIRGGRKHDYGKFIERKVSAGRKGKR